MKFLNVRMYWLVVGFSVFGVSNAFANCDKINGLYAVQGQYLGGGLEGPISKIWGKSAIQFASESAVSCFYLMKSQVQIFADPFKNGVQTIEISKVQGPIGQNFSIQNRDGSEGGQGTYMQGTDHLTFMISRGGCGSETGNVGMTCDMNLFLTKQ